MKKGIGLLLGIFAIFVFQMTTYAKEDGNIITEHVPKDATKFALEKYEEIIDASYGYYESLSSYDTSEYSLGNPYIIYDYDKDYWQEIYYYPVWQGDEAVMIVSIIKTTNGWTLSASDEMIDYINALDNFKYSDYLLYIKDGEINCKLILNYDSEILKIAEKMQTMIPTDCTKTATVNTAKAYIEYTPSFSTSTSTSKVCSLYNAKGQGIYPICWAAAAATIVNYRKGSNYSACDICDNAGKDYLGASMEDILNTINSYNISYDICDYQISWERVKSNINGKYPIAVTGTNMLFELHEVVAYGYRTINTSDCVILWNPGKSSSQTVYYLSGESAFSSTVFTHDNQSWTWQGTIAKYI